VKFVLGDKVAWTSQAAGSWRYKMGTVVEVVPPGAYPSVRGCGMPRDHESYVIKVGSRKYWPRVSLLRAPSFEVSL
jgi:hypothetical protein